MRKRIEIVVNVLPVLLKSTNFAVGTTPGFPRYPGGGGGTAPGGMYPPAPFEYVMGA